MGKITTEGSVRLEFDPDFYQISVTVYAERESSGAAITAGKAQTETLLQALKTDLQIEPSQITAEAETVGKSRFDERKNKEYFSYSRNLLLRIPANNHVREAVTDLLAKTDSVTYTVSVKLNDEEQQKQAALDAAVQCAKAKAEEIAAALQCKVSGFDEILTNGAHRMQHMKLRTMADRGWAAKNISLSEELQNPKIPITGEVTVVWLTEPLA